MDFNLNDEQELFVAGIRELMASENWEAYFAECDRDSVYPERFVKALADMGIDSLLIPEEHGGLEAGFVTVAAVWMELGRLGAPTYVLYQLPGGFNTFLREGTQEQIDKIMAFGEPVSRCGTLPSPNRERIGCWQPENHLYT